MQKDIYLDLTNFEKYLKRSLKNKGINTDNIKIQTGNTETEDTSDSGTSTMFNEFTAQKVDVTAATTSKSGNNFLILMFFGENKNHTYIKAVYNAWKYNTFSKTYIEGYKWKIFLSYLWCSGESHTQNTPCPRSSPLSSFLCEEPTGRSREARRGIIVAGYVNG